MAIIFVGCSTAGRTARADLVAQYDFTGNLGNEEFEPPFFTAPDLTASNLRHGAGLTRDVTSSPTLADSFVARNWVGPAPGDFFTFTLTPADGATLQVTSFEIGAVSDNGGPTLAAIRSSLDGFASDIGLFPVNLTFSDHLIDLSGAPLLLSGATEFRLVGFGASNNGAFLALTSANGTAGVVVNGSITPAAVPEPSAALLLALAGVIAGGACRLRRSCVPSQQAADPSHVPK